MSPKGVEHLTIEVTQDDIDECIHQCRRKALSTMVNHLAGPRLDVHPSMSPKGVEHLRRSEAAALTWLCIHQCRRKALSTGKGRKPLMIPTPCNQLAALTLHALFSHVPQTRQGHHLSPGSIGQEPWIGRRGCSKHGRAAGSQGHPIKDYSPHKLVFSRGWSRRWAPSGPGELFSSLRPRCSRPADATNTH